MKKILAILSVFVMLISISPPALAADNTTKSGIPALDINVNLITEVFARIDNDNMTYIGAHRPEEMIDFISQLNSIGPLPYLGTGKSVAGDIIIRTCWGKRYSYYIESPNALNINGKRYKVSEKQLEPIKNLVQLLVDNDEYRTYPKWFAWMNPVNVSGYKQFQPLIANEDFVPYEWTPPDADLPEEISFLTDTLFDYYCEIEKGERYELPGAPLPKDQEYYEMIINFKSGTSYKIMAHGTTFLLESSDMEYGCKYTIKFNEYYKLASIREAYSRWTDLLAHLPAL